MEINKELLHSLGGCYCGECERYNPINEEYGRCLLKPCTGSTLYCENVVYKYKDNFCSSGVVSIKITSMTSLSSDNFIIDNNIYNDFLKNIE